MLGPSHISSQQPAYNFVLVRATSIARTCEISCDPEELVFGVAGQGSLTGTGPVIDTSVGRDLTSQLMGRHCAQ
jgi:hypothetical protein